MTVRATEAARAAHADEFIRRLPYGYDTPLERAPFSGGELQRLGIAQALSRPARVLVFDDATSSLDMATELEVMTAVEEARPGPHDAHRHSAGHDCGPGRPGDLAGRGQGQGLRPSPGTLCHDPDYLATIAPGVAEEVTHVVSTMHGWRLIGRNLAVHKRRCGPGPAVVWRGQLARAAFRAADRRRFEPWFPGRAHNGVGLACLGALVPLFGLVCVRHVPPVPLVRRSRRGRA